MEQTITAVEMARKAGVDPKVFRGELRAEGFRWHAHNERWTVLKGSAEHQSMQAVLDSLTRR